MHKESKVLAPFPCGIRRSKSIFVWFKMVAFALLHSKKQKILSIKGYIIIAMRILLVQHAKENQESYPIGLGYVAGVLLREAYKVEFLDLAFKSDPVNGLARTIQSFKPQALGFTLLTSQYDEFVSIIRQCDTARELKVVVRTACQCRFRIHTQG